MVTGSGEEQLNGQVEGAHEAGNAQEGVMQIKLAELWTRAENPIRNISESLSKSLASQGGPAPKETISLLQGDPTMYGHMPPPQVAVDAMADALKSFRCNGYQPSTGNLDTRRAVVEKYKGKNILSVSAEDDVFITSGGSAALELCLEVLYKQGANLLLPCPTFPLYESYCQRRGLEMRFYRLLPEKQWKVDLAHVEELADSNTVALLLCNPGNPTGAVFTEEHLQEIAEVAKRLGLLIISDEVYSEQVFAPGRSFVHVAAITEKVPVISIGSISKMYLVPGWRLGWILINDPMNIFRKAGFQKALASLMQSEPTACSLVQATAAKMLRQTPEEYHVGVNETLSRSAAFCHRRIEEISGLECKQPPEGGMFIMVRILLEKFPGVRNDMDWCAQLLKEEAVVFLPGTACRLPGWARIMVATPLDVLEVAFTRVEDFCRRHISDI
eukprot:TRINITY_DN13071_c0_g1_i1.p1 TRINITY_DN13071_c0_g1~~TRINITY_DN13071_c0_g1_i1.p1  ORF type:complete len:443 (-),score=104.49 TRINITY_DN13071_c0_g1_i1:129-1457(-)